MHRLDARPIDPQLRDRALGALLGLAVGDAIGMPALYHRSVRLGDKRRALWTQALVADEHRVLTFPLPFTVADTRDLALSGTDDVEMAAITAKILLEQPAGGPSGDALMTGWRRYIVDSTDAWLGVAERASVVNIGRGLAAPCCGGDNPAYAHDGAIARSIPIGIALHGQPRKAASLARTLAAITHAEDGIWAAGAMAATIAAQVGGVQFDAAFAAGLDEIPKESWLQRNIERAFAILDEAGSSFAAVPRWTSEIANGTYSYGSIAAETLPIAYAIVSSTPRGIGSSVQIAALIAKQSDSMPAMAGALAGALAGTADLPPSWISALDKLKGVTIPAVAGMSLADLADDLLRLQWGSDSADVFAVGS